METYVLIATYDGLSDCIAISTNQSSLKILAEKLNKIPTSAVFSVNEVPFFDANPLVIGQDQDKKRRDEIRRRMFADSKKSISHE